MIQTHLKCECGYQGAVRVLDDKLARCIGCDQLYSVDQKGTVMAMTEIPKFQSYEEMQKFLDKAITGKSKGDPVKRTKRSRKQKPVQSDPAKNLVEQTSNPESIFKTIHFYIRPGDTFDQVLKDGREEVKYSNNNVLVYCHEHNFDQPCLSSCRGMN